MKNFFVVSIFILLVLLIYTATASANQTRKRSRISRILIRVKSGTSRAQLGEAIKRQLTQCDFNIQPLLTFEPHPLFRKYGLDRTYVVESKDCKLIPDELCKHTPQLCEFAEPDGIGYGGGERPNDPLFVNQWGLENVQDHDIDMLGAWDVSTGSEDTIIAVLDSGINRNHEEFQGKLLQGYDFANRDDYPDDDHGHGSNVAGIAAANTNNSVGIAGVCPKCKILPYKVLTADNFGYYSWWADALNEAVWKHATVINMSLGGNSDSQTLHNAIRATVDAGIPIVACMMNSNNDTLYYPAAFPETIAVGATNREDERAHPFSWSPDSGSNFGPHIDIVAPGTTIIGPGLSDDGYEPWSGTSQATPHVTGTVALMKSVDPSLTPEEIRQILHDTAEDQVGDPSEDIPGFDIYYGYGRLNAQAALEEAMQFLEERENEEESIESETESELDGDVEASDLELSDLYDESQDSMDLEPPSEVEQIESAIDTPNDDKIENPSGKGGGSGCGSTNDNWSAMLLMFVLLANLVKHGKIYRRD